MYNNILVLTTSYHQDDGIIAGSFVAEQCEQLVLRGYEINILSPHSAKQKQNTIINGVIVNRFRYFFPTKFQKIAYRAGIPTNLKNSYFAIFQLPFFILSFFINTWKLSKNTKLIYAHWTISALVAIITKKVSKGKKVIFMNHGAEVFVIGHNYLGKKFIRFILRNSDFVISNSSYTFNKTQEIWKIENHMVIAPGYDDTKFFPSLFTYKNRFKISDDTFILFSLGNFIERKGFEYLIKSMNIIVNQTKNTNIISLIGGKGPLLKKFEKMIKEYNLEKNIILVGYIKQEELATFYNTCHVFVHPAIIDRNNDTEGLGVVLSEANACGKPVIASRVGGIPDVIIHDYNGLLVDEKNEKQLVDAILKLTNNSELLKQMGDSAQRHALKNFTWKNNAEKTVGIFNSLR